MNIGQRVRIKDSLWDRIIPAKRGTPNWDAYLHIMEPFGKICKIYKHQEQLWYVIKTEKENNSWEVLTNEVEVYPVNFERMRRV